MLQHIIKIIFQPKINKLLFDSTRKEKKQIEKKLTIFKIITLLNL